MDGSYCLYATADWISSGHGATWCRREKGVHALIVKEKQQVSQSWHNRRLSIQPVSVGRTLNDNPRTLQRSIDVQCESLGEQGSAQPIPLQTNRTQQRNSDASHTTTSREGRELVNNTNEVKPIKLAYWEKTLDGHAGRRGISHNAFERELNAPAVKVTTTTTHCDAQFCFGNRSNLCSASAINPGLWLREGGGCKGS